MYKKEGNIKMKEAFSLEI